jgi:O6-methylguanine-DNA--protein-cysteine methyltransferase
VGQIQLARQELADAEATIRTGIEKVLKHLTELDSQSLSLDEFKLLTTSFDGIVKVLVDTIEEVRALVAATVANAAEAYDLLRPLGGLASDLTAVIRSVSGQMHLIGLNAQVKAVQVSQHCRGQGLEVLSARTSEISQETSRLSGQAAAQLDAMVAGLTESVRAFEKLQVRGHEQQAHLNEQGRKYEQQLQEIRDGSVKTLQVIAASLKDISRQAGVALESIKFKPFHEVTLPALQAPLLALSAAAEQCLLRRGQRLAANALVEGFQRDYTMVSERHVLAGAITNGFQSSVAPVSSAPASPRVALLPAIPAAPPPTVNPPPAPADAGRTAPVDLGANVELF